MPFGPFQMLGPNTQLQLHETHADVKHSARHGLDDFDFDAEAGDRHAIVANSVEPKVRLQGYGYNPFCSHSSRCLAVLV